MLTVRIQEKNYSESIMVLKLKDGFLEDSFSINRLTREVVYLF